MITSDFHSLHVGMPYHPVVLGVARALHDLFPLAFDAFDPINNGLSSWSRGEAVPTAGVDRPKPATSPRRVGGRQGSIAHAACRGGRFQ